MSVGIRFTVGRHMQNFTIHRDGGFGLWFTRTSSQSMRQFWFSLSSNAYVSEHDSFRAATENVSFSMGNTYQRFDAVADDCFYNYEDDQDRGFDDDYSLWADAQVRAQAVYPPF